MTEATALLLVDLQHDFVDAADLTPDLRTLTKACASLLEYARHSGWHVIHCHTQVDEDPSKWLPHWRAQGKPRCLAGTSGAQALPEFAPVAGEPVFLKRGYNAFDNHDLKLLIEAQGIGRVVVAGVHTHACIRETAVAAAQEGLAVSIARDAVSSYDPEHARLALSWMEGRVAQLVTVGDLVSSSSAPAAQRKPVRWQHRDPADQQRVLCEITSTEPEDCRAAFEGLARAQVSWAALPAEGRLERLKTWAHLLAQRRQAWVDILVRQVGKPKRDAEGEVAYGLAILEQVCAGQAEQDDDAVRTVAFRPLGVIGAITPWNNPFAIPISKLAPALAYGNTVAWKPSLQAGDVSRELTMSLGEAGLGDYVAMIAGDADVGRLLVESPEVAGISFTGSCEVGRAIALSAARLGRPFQGEMGGNNAAIIMPGANLDWAASDLAVAMFSFAGQRCTAIRRLLVDDTIIEDFAAKLKVAIANLRIGLPDSPTTDVGPVISRQHQQSLEAAVAQAEQENGVVFRAALDGGQLPGDGCWFAPTLVSGLGRESALVRTETFGPICVLLPVNGIEDAIACHNHVEFGLLGTIYTADKPQQAKFIRSAQAGLLSINRARPPFSPKGPFRGLKASGSGPAEHGRWNRETYTVPQAIYIADPS